MSVAVRLILGLTDIAAGQTGRNDWNSQPTRILYRADPKYCKALNVRVLLCRKYSFAIEQRLLISQPNLIALRRRTLSWFIFPAR